jgi:hypothetical protein
VAVAAPEQQRILEDFRIRAEEHRMPVQAAHPIAQAWVSTISAITKLSPEDTPLPRNMG